MSSHNNLTSFSVREASWLEAQPELREIRHRVFIEEQQVSVVLEWDGLDENAIHLLACNAEGLPIGCARILDDGAIGRMAVLKAWRGLGAGRALLDAAIASCRSRGYLDIRLSAQTHAISFYERAGFVVCSGEYLDAGIPHRDMHLKLSV